MLAWLAIVGLVMISPVRVAAMDPTTAGLPNVLPGDDAARYREIFDLQAAGRMRAAANRFADLEDARLMGHVLAQRYLHPTAYRASYRELIAWLDTYPDLPMADRVYRLAVSRKPKRAARPARPVADADRLNSPPEPPSLYRSAKRLSWPERERVRRLRVIIKWRVKRNQLSSAARLLASAEVRRLFDAFETDDARAALAAGWFYQGEPAKALALAAPAAARSGDKVPTVYWTAGLAAWQLDKIAEATRYFEALGAATAASEWNRAAGAFWAARGLRRLGEDQRAEYWLAVAGRYKHTFYGLLGAYQAGVEPEFDFTPRAMTVPDIVRLERIPATARALALLEIGERDGAIGELMATTAWRQPAVAESILRLTEAAALPMVSLALAKRLKAIAPTPNGRLDGPLYPVPPWRPESGFIVDRALVFAWMRQESSFDARARSPDDARGLMQLMPRTARTLADSRAFQGEAAGELYDPALNIDLGQRYLARLLRLRRIEGDLLHLAAAYNGGPGNLGHWQRRMDHGDDPLVFLETIPTLETRLFVERVLTNLWIYRIRFGQPTPSLAALANGRWPLYVPLDDGSPPTD